MIEQEKVHNTQITFYKSVAVARESPTRPLLTPANQWTRVLSVTKLTKSDQTLIRQEVNDCHTEDQNKNWDFFSPLLRQLEVV